LEAHRNGQEEQEPQNSPLLKLLQRPNEHYTGPMLWMATTTDWNVNGEAYWIVIPSRATSRLSFGGRRPG
jgi:phage portal protein BeeE